MQPQSESTRTTAPYGAWASPLDAARVTAGALRFGDIALDREDVYWTEGRAAEGGRYVVVRRTPDGRTLDVTPGGFNVRSRVHEYGGAAMAVHDGDVYFANFADQRVYRQRGGGDPTPLTPAGYFYADLRVDPSRRRLLAVREDHRQGDAEPPAALVAVSVDATEGERPGVVLVSGADFYSDPVVSPDGGTLAWLQWNHPNMPWDGTELWTAPFNANGTLGPRRRIAGGADESVFQPEWSPDGVLYFVSDRTGWWNLYRLRRRGSRGARWPAGRRAAAPDGRRVRQAAVDLLDGHLCLRRGAPHRRQLRAERPLEARLHRDQPGAMGARGSGSRRDRRAAGRRARAVLHRGIADGCAGGGPNDAGGDGAGGVPALGRRADSNRP